MTKATDGNWHRIWSNRTPIDTQEGSVLQKLICIDGFDSPLGLMKEEQWNDYVALFARRSGIVPSDSIFEVGCGCGAFLYPFFTKDHEVGGIDYSSELVQIAQTVMPGRAAFFRAAEASSCPVDPEAEAVIANHVIHYFPSLEYSSMALELMLRKARRVVTISGIPDASLRQESENERRGLLKREEYESKYRGLDILYYQKDWFEALAVTHGFVPRFFDHEMPGFAQNRFRFDCVMTRI